MSKLNTKRGAILGVVMALALAGAAFAYWTSTGSGTGSASAAGGSTPLTAVQTTVLTPMFPGDTAQTISGNFNNPNSGPIYVSSVTVSISSVTKASGAAAGTCDATDFTLATPVMSVATEVAAGTAKGAFTGAKINFNNKTSNQDACKGATVALAYVIA